MSVWDVSPIEDEPETVLHRWHVFETPAGSRHFCGYVESLREGRVSTAVKQFDPATMTGRTASGRVYSLEGPGGFHPDALYVRSAWLRLNGLGPEVEVVEDLHALPAVGPATP